MATQWRVTVHLSHNYPIQNDMRGRNVTGIRHAIKAAIELASYDAACAAHNLKNSTDEQSSRALRQNRDAMLGLLMSLHLELAKPRLWWRTATGYTLEQSRLAWATFERLDIKKGESQ